MTDPYGVIGVSPNASDSDIKKAYRDLARKYHPDNYADNPLADLAQEKMKEINEAYDDIQRMRGGGASGGAYDGDASYSRSGTNAESTRIRSVIAAGNIELAEELLRAYQPRDAEWHFLMGSLHYRKGWLDDAISYYQTAASMNPGNAEYRQALGRMNYRGPAYNPYGGRGVQNGGCDACDICTAMLCANMCCHCSV